MGETDRTTTRLVLAAALAACLSIAPRGAAAFEPEPIDPALLEAQSARPADVALYCEAVRDPAAEARAAWHAKALLEIEARIEARLAELAAARAELEAALARREEHLRQAEEGIVAIYARMRPDAAAAQLAALDDEMASAVLARLGARQASAILNEMEPGRAAQLTRAATDAARRAETAREQSL